MKSPSATARNATAITANQAKARAAQLVSATDSTFKSSLSLANRVEKASHVTNLPRSGRILAEVAVPENMYFRQMELRDAAAVFHLGEEIFNADSFPQLYRTWDAFEVIENLDGDGELCLVAEEVLEGVSSGIVPTGEGGPGRLHPHGRIVGFIFGSITEKRKQEHSCGLLGWVGVAPSHQRRNIGTVLAHKLFEAFLEEGISLIVADTPKENTPAIQFLHRMGFGTPVYHVYMSLNLARHQQRTQHLPPPQERVLPPEAKGVKLRPMSIDDLAAVHDLGERVYDRHLYPNLYRIWSESEVLELFGSDSEFCRVAEYEGKVVGFVMGTTISKRRSSWRYGYLVWLGVAPEVQRFGVGKRLFQSFQDLMVEDGCRIIMIDTQADNLPARKFFERAGFGSLESHVYFSKVVGPEDVIDSEEMICRQPSFTDGESPPSSTFNNAILAAAVKSKRCTHRARKSGGFKVTRLFRFKRSHSVLETATIDDRLDDLTKNCAATDSSGRKGDELYTYRAVGTNGGRDSQEQCTGKKGKASSARCSKRLRQKATEDSKKSKQET